MRERKAGVNKERQGSFLYLTLHRVGRPHSGKVRTPGPTLCIVMGAGCPAMKGQAGFGPRGSQRGGGHGQLCTHGWVSQGSCVHICDLAYGCVCWDRRAFLRVRVGVDMRMCVRAYMCM